VARSDAPPHDTTIGARPASAVTTPSGSATRGLGGRILASPNAKRVAAQLGVELAHVNGTGPGGRIVTADVEGAAREPRPVAVARATPPALVAAAPVRAAGTGRAVASFAARMLADDLGIDLDTVGSLSGDVRLSRDDVLAHARVLIARATGAVALPPLTASPAPAPAAAPRAVAPLLQQPTEVIPLRGMRGTIASRMHDSLQQMAQLTLHMDVDMSAVIADRAARQAQGAAPGFTDYIVAATARALRDHPYVNSQITADGVALLPEVHVGLAVAVEHGLLVPVVRHADTLALADLAAETARLAAAARAGTLKLTELEGGTCSVTALGMYGVDGFTPVVNAPNTAILGVGRLRDDTAWHDESPRRTTVLTLSLTWDHRAFDGAPAAEFTRTVKQRLEACELS
jgi:pyruvate dehydrogenase E2 component (dihydrolipoamide acetyltransferase)